MENGLVIQVLRWHDWLDDMLHKILVDLIVGDVWGVLCGDEDGVYSLWDHGSVYLLVLDCDLCLAVWAQPGDCAILPDLHMQDFCQTSHLARRQLYGTM